MQTISKPWGKEELLDVQNKYVVKRLFMKKRCRCSLQYHKKKTETIIVIDGILLIHLDDRIISVLRPGEYMTILPGRKHRMEGSTDVTYMEVSTPELDDVVRLRDDYGRI